MTVFYCLVHVYSWFILSTSTVLRAKGIFYTLCSSIVHYKQSCDDIFLLSLYLLSAGLYYQPALASAHYKQNCFSYMYVAVFYIITSCVIVFHFFKHAQCLYILPTSTSLFFGQETFSVICSTIVHYNQSWDDSFLLLGTCLVLVSITY